MIAQTDEKCQVRGCSGKEADGVDVVVALTVSSSPCRNGAGIVIRSCLVLWLGASVRGFKA